MAMVNSTKKTDMSELMLPNPKARQGLSKLSGVGDGDCAVECRLHGVGETTLICVPLNLPTNAFHHTMLSNETSQFCSTIWLSASYTTSLTLLLYTHSIPEVHPMTCEAPKKPNIGVHTAADR